ncbi:hypothetical protein IJ135_02205 [Candidatus Saccharibacteria bacterium]|nr:hypothetical protein [Candidatus Saccharibacteria bacterium]
MKHENESHINTSSTNTSNTLTSDPLQGSHNAPFNTPESSPTGRDSFYDRILDESSSFNSPSYDSAPDSDSPSSYFRSTGAALVQAANFVRPDFSDFYDPSHEMPHKIAARKANLENHLQKFEKEKTASAEEREKAGLPPEPDNPVPAISEALLTSILNDNFFRVSPGRQQIASYAFPGSRYDDVINKTDCVLVMNRRLKKDETASSEPPITLSIDVASGVTEENIVGKFESSYNPDYKDKDAAPAMTSRVIFCKYGDSAWEEESPVPHFIVGIDPSSIRDTITHATFSEGSMGGTDNINYILPGFDRNALAYQKTEFKLTSELYEEARSQKDILKSKINLAKLHPTADTKATIGEYQSRIDDIENITYTFFFKLCDLLDIPTGTPIEDRHKLFTER